MRLSKLIEVFEKRWPSSDADDWDRVGLLVGSSDSEIRRILIAVDLTDAVIKEAIGKSCNLVLTHHPALLRGVHTIAETSSKGSMLSALIRADISAFSAHTNADVQKDGASTLMAKAFGLSELKPLVAGTQGFGHGVIGCLDSELSLSDFALLISSKLPPVARKVVFSGLPAKKIKFVAICSGAGDFFIDEALKSQADVYVTSDLRHHPALEAIQTPRENGQLALIDVSHWASESLWVSGAAESLAELDSVEVLISEVVSDPWTKEVN